jgi:hypothetical protein
MKKRHYRVNPKKEFTGGKSNKKKLQRVIGKKKLQGKTKHVHFARVKVHFDVEKLLSADNLNQYDLY